MWFNLDDTDLHRIDMLFPELGERLRKEQVEQQHPDMQKYRDAVPVSDGDLEVDAEAIVSKGDDPGAYVMTWKWVCNDEAGVETPESEVFKEGRAAFAEGKSADANPYAQMSEHEAYADWLEGWLTAEEEAEVRGKV